METVILIELAAAFYVAWGIGAGDESMAPLVGSGFVDVKTAAIIGGVAAFLGAVLLGRGVEATIGKNLLTVELGDSDVIIILVSVATWLSLGSFLGLPISSIHSAVGSAVGLGLMKGGRTAVDWTVLSTIVIGGVAFPLIALVGSMGLSRLLRRILDRHARGLRPRIRIMRTSSLLLLFWVSLTSFSGGANNIAGATAFLGAASGYDPLLLRALVSAAMPLGLLVLGRRVLASVGLNIVELNPVNSLAIQVSAALTVLSGVMLGIPLSVTYILVGAMIGLGLEEGIWLNLKSLREIFLAWISTFLTSASMAVFAYLLVSLL